MVNLLNVYVLCGRAGGRAAGGDSKEVDPLRSAPKVVHQGLGGGRDRVPLSRFSGKYTREIRKLK